MASDESIIKLVFLREAVGSRASATPSTTRKAVVPLVEGADFEQFLSRVRRRFQLAEGGSVRLQADDGSAVDSIEGLLEVDESSTLLVALEGGSSGSAGGEPSASRLRGGAGASPARPAAAYATPVGAGGCRVDIPVSEWARGGHRGGGEHEETGDLKYRKRRGLAINLARLRRPIIAVAVLVGLVLVGLRLFAARA